MLLKVGQRSLKNRYFVLRHGESTANVAGIVSSTYKVAITNHGLTPKGIDQAKASAKTLVSLASVSPVSVDCMGNSVKSASQAVLTSDSDVVFYASDFARAYETAYHCRNALIDLKQLSSSGAATQRPSPSFFTSSALRERSFGDFEGASSHTSYDTVWARDTEEPFDSSHYNAESIGSVLHRVVSLVHEIEEIWDKKIIVFVSHGDVCQISQTAFMEMDGRKHRSLPHMNNCDVREMIIEEKVAM